MKMKAFLALLLAVSLTANVWLALKASPALRRDSGRASARLAAGTARSAKSAAATTAQPGNAVIQASLNLFVEAQHATDLAAFRDKLLAAGVDAQSIRDMIEGALRAHYFETIKIWRRDHNRNQWWLPRGALNTDGIPSSQALVVSPLYALCGPSALDIADAEVRYAFLPADKRRTLALIDLDYGELQERIHPTSLNYNPTKELLQADIDRLQYLKNERQKDLLDALTDEERAEYNLRFSPTIATVTSRFSAMNATEQEFRAIAPVLASLSPIQSLSPATTTMVTAASVTSRSALEQTALDQLVAAVGYDRAVDYAWSGSSPLYTETTNLLRTVDLPPTQAPRLLQLESETGVRAAAIHSDTTLTPDQKKAALSALQETAQTELDAVIPAKARANLPPQSFSWLTGLSAGRYQILQATVSNISFAPTVVSIASPPPPSSRSVLVVRRSAN
jgi:hypothetical protein